MSSPSAEGPLVCPRCARRYPLSERFCSHCRMPLTYVGSAAGDHPITAAQERARRIDPRYTGGELVRVATAQNQTEAEFVQALLMEEGIPSVQRRSAGFDVPDFLAAGPRDVMVSERGEQAAREMLRQAELPEAMPPSEAGTSPLRLAATLVTVLAVVTVLLYLLFHATA